ncbi:ClpXP protease specificity-enhancing factor, partial [mine drainage metagenome]
MIPCRPYLMHALYDWIVENHLTPHLLVDATCAGLVLPADLKPDQGRIVLNLSPEATGSLVLGLEGVEAELRFQGRPFRVSIPLRGCLGLFAEENGAGMVFPEEPDLPQTPASGPHTPEGGVSVPK